MIKKALNRHQRKRRLLKTEDTRDRNRKIPLIWWMEEDTAPQERTGQRRIENQTRFSV